MSRRERFFYCLKVFLAVRIGLMLLGAIAVAAIPARTLVSVPGWADHAYTSGWHNLFTAFEKQDALWFLRIATTGYHPTDSSAAFFPLYPMAVRFVTPIVGGHPLFAALLVSNAAFLAALCVLFSLTAHEFDENIARRSVLYIAIFPTSFFFFAPYSESLFLLMAVLAFWGARRGHWWVAGLAGAGAALTRSIGAAIAVALAVEAIHQWRGKEPGLVRKLAWSSSPVIGTLAYLAYWRSEGNWHAPLDFQSYWGRQPTFPLTALTDATKLAFRSGGVYHLMDWLIVMPFIALAVYVVFVVRPGYAVYVWTGIVFPLCVVWDGRPLMSMPRFLVVLFPAFWGLAILSERRRIPHELIIGVGAASMALMAAMFVNAWYVF